MLVRILGLAYGVIRWEDEIGEKAKLCMRPGAVAKECPVVRKDFPTGSRTCAWSLYLIEHMRLRKSTKAGHMRTNSVAWCLSLEASLVLAVGSMVRLKSLPS